MEVFMKKLTIKRLETLTIAKFVGTVNAIISIVVGLIGSFGAIISIVASNEYGAWESFGLSVALLAAGLILYPMLMFFIGWLYGALMALIFNIFVTFSGGITVDVEETK